MQDHSQPGDAPSVDAWQSVVEYGGPALRRPQARRLSDKDLGRDAKSPVGPDEEDDRTSDLDRFAAVAEGVLGKLVEEMRTRLDAAETALRDEVAGLREQLSAVREDLRREREQVAEVNGLLLGEMAAVRAVAERALVAPQVPASLLGLPDALATGIEDVHAQLALIRDVLARPSAGPEFPDELVQLPSAVGAALAEQWRELQKETAKTVETALAQLREQLGQEGEQLADANEVLLMELGAVRKQVERMAAAGELPERLLGVTDVPATEVGGSHA